MNILDRIHEQKRQEVAIARGLTSESQLLEMASGAGTTRGFLHALASVRGLGLIAEVKKASPSRGLIRAEFDPEEIAMAYEAAGANCLSVLTDSPNFLGSLKNLAICRGATSLPCLRKDFICDPYQVLEARAWGADAILLIVSMLEESQIVELQQYARSLEMDVLVEVHDEGEAIVALECGANMIGVNNRNLKDFQTSLHVSERVIPLLKGRCMPVSESALKTRADLDRVEAVGAKAVLIGTTFCESLDIESKVREVMGTQ